MAAYVTSLENKEPTSVSRWVPKHAGRFALTISGNLCCLSAPRCRSASFRFAGYRRPRPFHRSSVIDHPSSLLARTPKSISPSDFLFRGDSAGRDAFLQVRRFTAVRERIRIV